MPRNGSGVYSAPAGTKGVPDTPIESAKYNALVDDLVQDANSPRPITAGGTGAANATDARANIGALGVADVQTATLKNPPVDGDSFVITDSANGGALKRVLWTVMKTVMKAYLDPFYQVDLTKVSTIELAGAVGTNTASYIDFNTSTVISDYNARIIRGAGINGALSFFQTGSAGYIFNNAGISIPDGGISAQIIQSSVGRIGGTDANGDMVFYNTGANSLILRPNGSGSSSGQFSISTSGFVRAASTIQIANDGFMSSDGNLGGSTWEAPGWGPVGTSAKNAISIRMEARGAVYRDAAVAQSASDLPANLAGMAVGTLGTYALLCITSETTSLAPGGTISGSGTQYANADASSLSAGPSGSWRGMGRTIASSSTVKRTTLFLRYA